ncbi:MAG TPA: hypothetical protein VIP48_18600 [Streptosporangiaceae bacterium]
MSRSPITLAAPRRRRARWVPALMAAAVVCLLAGLWAALLLLGVPVPVLRPALADVHGQLMTLGFLGTFIALERAVALGQPWGYLAPAAAGAGGLAVMAGVPGSLGEALIGVGGVVLVAIFIAVLRIQPALHNVVLAAGAVCWVVAAGLWLAGWDISRFVPWLAGFLVLTITGERLELSRLTGVPGRARLLFAVAAAVFLAGLLTSLAAGPAAATAGAPVPTGIRVTGAGMILLAAWLARYDIARRTWRSRGLPRYIAVALLAGYGWLAVAGGLWLGIGQMADGPAYDAQLHALFLGFVMSMIFAHAPVIVPAVLGRPLPFRPVLYVPVALLYAALVLRLAGGDWAGSTAAWQWGGVLNEVAILLFLALAAALVLRSRRANRRPGSRSGRPVRPDVVTAPDRAPRPH